MRSHEETNDINTDNGNHSLRARVPASALRPQVEIIICTSGCLPALQVVFVGYKADDEREIEMTTTIITRPPAVGLPVKLKRGMLMLSARQVQHVTKVKKLEIGKDNIDMLSELEAEGGYWIQTDYTKGEWWASKSVKRFTAGTRGVLWGYGQGEWVRYSDYEQLQSTLAQVERERDALREKLLSEKALDSLTDRTLKPAVHEAIKKYQGEM